MIKLVLLKKGRAFFSALFEPKSPKIVKRHTGKKSTKGEEEMTVLMKLKTRGLIGTADR